jgi:polyisoprenyl-phosphate glycosyltransferase
MLTSIVVPVFNASKFVHLLFEAVETERVSAGWDLELVVVDDGSRDDTFDRVSELAKKYPYIRAIKLSRNFGQQAAVRTGLVFCKGDYIAIIDDDLQDPPSLLPEFFGFLDRGYDVAYGQRRERKENFLKRVTALAFYRILRRLSNVDIPLDSGEFCVMKRRVLDNILLLQEKNPFLRGMRAWVGFRQVAVEYDRQSRVAGESTYTLSMMLKLAVDGIFSFSLIPIRVITLTGLVGLFVAVVYSGILVALYIAGQLDVRGFTTLVLLISFFGSLNLICLGVIGEYIARIYSETLNRPHSVIEKTLNL